MTIEEIRQLLKSGAEEDRLRGVVELARSGHPATAGVLRQLAGSDPGNRVRYAARKLLDVLGRAAPAEAATHLPT